MRNNSHYTLQKLVERAVLSDQISTTYRKLKLGQNQTNAFILMYKVPIRLPKITRERILATAEAIAIHLQNPTLCQHSKFVQALHLNRPNSNVITSISRWQRQKHIFAHMAKMWHATITKKL